MSRITKKKAIEFLDNHFTYYPMNSWNGGTVYAHNVKIYNLKTLNSIEEDNLYKIIEDEHLGYEFYEQINFLIAEWQEENKPFEVYFNGRSDGYIILKVKGSYDYHHDQEELEEMTADEVREVYNEVKAFDKLRDKLEAEAKWFAQQKIEEIEVKTSHKIKQFKGA